MKKIYLSLFAVAMMFSGCGTEKGEAASDNSGSPARNEVVETIMSRRSIRDYEERAVNRDTMDIIAKCGINAPNAMNAQSWEVRIVDSKEFLDSVTGAFLKENGDAGKKPGFRNMFRNAPTVAFIAAGEGSYSMIDCGLLSENMILSAWSMGIGSCCLGSPVAFINSPAGKEYLERLGFSEGNRLVLAIGFGYPAEAPEAKERDGGKVRYVE